MIRATSGAAGADPTLRTRTRLRKLIDGLLKERCRVGL